VRVRPADEEIPAVEMPPLKVELEVKVELMAPVVLKEPPEMVMPFDEERPFVSIPPKKVEDAVVLEVMVPWVAMLPFEVVVAFPFTKNAFEAERLAPWWP
jgi:hypothetical protein